MEVQEDLAKYFGYAGVFTAPWWIASIALFGYLEPNYSHFYKAVSELGAFGAANWLAMNVICLFATGALIIAAALRFRHLLTNADLPRTASTWLFVTGIMFAGTAIPADMDLYFKSPWTLVHAFFVFLGVVPFLFAAWKTPKALRELGIKSNFISYFPLAIIPVFAMHGFVAQGGLVQRSTILVLLVWVSYLSYLLVKIDPAHNKLSGS